MDHYYVLWRGGAYGLPKSAIFRDYARQYEPALWEGCDEDAWKRLEFFARERGRKLVGMDWKIHDPRNGKYPGGEFGPAAIVLVRAKLEEEGPTVFLWYFRFADYGSGLNILHRVPKHVFQKCQALWGHSQRLATSQLFRQGRLPPNDNANSFDPVLNRWKKVEPVFGRQLNTTVITMWDVLRPYARFVGSLRAALRAWHDEVRHRPEHMCKKDERGETEASRAMEAEMAAPVFTEGALGA